MTKFGLLVALTVCSTTPMAMPLQAQALKEAKPTVSESSWFEQPKASIVYREEGEVAFRLIVNALGRVDSCGVTATNAPSALSGETCRLAQRNARFSPLTGNSDEAVKRVYAGRKLWGLPVKLAPESKYGLDEISFNKTRVAFQLPAKLIAYSLMIDPAGMVTSCSIKQSLGSKALDDSTCRTMVAYIEKYVKFTKGFRTLDGKPVMRQYDSVLNAKGAQEDYK